jgi:heme-degrading monooxygenase HmoA
MIARIVTVPLKTVTKSEFAKTIEKDVLPLLRTHKGFLDHISMVTSDGKNGVGITIWDTRESAEAYNRSSYNQVMKTLDSVVAGPAQVQVCEVTNSTVHKLAAAA